MQFESLSEFWAMGGHGLYVWLSYGMGVLILGLNLISARQSRGRVLNDLAQRQRRDAQLKKQRVAASQPDSRSDNVKPSNETQLSLGGEK